MSEGTRSTRQFYGSSSGGGRTSIDEGRGGRYGGGGTGAARGSGVNTGILDEHVLSLVFRSINWDPQAVCTAACVSRRMRAVAERVLWRELCISRAPRMILFFCCGAAGPGVPGHFTRMSRFSKTSGRSFLSRRCRSDLLYVSDPCEHAVAGAADDLGAYRGVFRGFMRSQTRACLVGRQAALDPRVRCPYCGARVWSMVAAGMVPRTAWRRLGCLEGRLEYYVCVSGHLHGNCWLARLTSSEGEHDGGSGSDSDASTQGGGSDDDGHVAL
uniref:F-box domain-containing protein n=1 Tax=Oryza punctata TaxID=4537 RepID=A0A0E0JPW9_ORYPU